MWPQSTTYRERLNAVLADAQINGKYPGGFCVRVSENGHSLYTDVADSEEERRDPIPPSATDDDYDEVFPSRQSFRSLFYTVFSNR